MKFRYLKINGSLAWGTNELTRSDLVNRKVGAYDWLIDLKHSTYYDPDLNDWVELEGTE